MTRRLLFGYLLAALVVLLVLEIPLAIFYQQREMVGLERDVERDATVLAGYYEEGLEAGARLNPAAADAYARRTDVRVVVTDKTGTSVIDTAGPAGRDFSTRPEIKTALAGGRAVGTRYSHTLKTDLLYVAIPASSAGDVHGAVLTRKQLIEDVWDQNWWGSTKTLDVHIASLRKKLTPELIETVRGVGFRLAEAADTP